MKKNTEGRDMQDLQVEAAKDVGKRFTRKFGGLAVEVEIMAVKFAYGRKLWLVEVAGQTVTNQVWVDGKAWPAQR